MSIFNNCDITCLKMSNSVKKTQNKGYYGRSKSFKVIEVGTNRKPVCDFLLVINSNISLSQIIPSHSIVSLYTPSWSQ